MCIVGMLVVMGVVNYVFVVGLMFDLFFIMLYGWLLFGKFMLFVLMFVLVVGNCY